MTADVVTLPTAALRDAAAHLRALADAIERGDHGRVLGCAVVLDAPRLVVSYAGDSEAVPTGHLLLCLGASVVLGRLVKERTK